MVISFPEWEIPGIRRRLSDRGHFFTTRVSQELGKYKPGQILTSPLGPLLVGHVWHYDKLSEHPYLTEMSLPPDQMEELAREAAQGGLDLVLLAAWTF